jgi:thiosulfate dehydrogenase [quinone] large subunit
VPEAASRKTIEWLDLATMWGHTILGACLLLGLFSRLASFLLAMFLLSVTLIAPALPYAPTPPGAIGYYLYINLYAIEMIALLALTCIATGRWFGLDALLYYMTHGAPRARPAIADVLPRRG